MRILYCHKKSTVNRKYFNLHAIVRNLALCLVIILPVEFAYSRDTRDVIAAPFADPLFVDKTSLHSDHPLPPCPIIYDVQQPLSLAQAVGLALCNHPQIQNAWANVAIQASSLGEARAAYLPSITASLSRFQDKTEYPAANGNLGTQEKSNTISGSFSWRLFDFGGRNANQRSANALLRAALANHQATVQTTLASVISAYFDAQTARATWQNKQDNTALLEKICAIAQRRESKGAGSKIETMQATISLTRATLEKNHAKAAYQKSLAVLALNIGLPSTTALNLAEDIEDQDHSLRQDLDAWWVEVQQQHPTLLAARQQMIAAQEKVTVTESEGLPSLDFSANIYKNGRPNQSLTPNTQETLVGITLNIPIFDGFARTYKIRGAQAQVEQKKAELLEAERQVLLEMVKTYADANAALENLDASKKFLESAQIAFYSTQQKFNQGAADMSAVLNMQAMLLDAEEERTRCLAEWHSTKLKLLAHAGLLESTSLQSVGEK